jgi:ATP-dependent RNA helicase DHX57
VAGSKSDHLAVVAAYNGWVAAVERGGRGAGQDFCAQHFVSDQAMEVRWRAVT